MKLWSLIPVSCHLLLAFGLCFILSSPTHAVTITAAPCDEEFVGPFASWRNVKTYYGAKGDGVTDDTTALQNALNDLRTAHSNGWSVLFFPAGTYKITSMLITTQQAGADYFNSEIVGADPNTTSISWAGSTRYHAQPRWRLPGAAPADHQRQRHGRHRAAARV